MWSEITLPNGKLEKSTLGNLELWVRETLIGYFTAMYVVFYEDENFGSDASKVLSFVKFLQILF